MANWAFTSYVIEGNKETLERIFNAIQNPILDDDASEGWEGGVLKALNIDWQPRTIVSEKTEGDKTYIETSGYYMRGFIEPDSAHWYNDTIVFEAKEAWGATDFHEVLEKNISGIKVFYSVEEEEGEIYATNDKEGKYFPSRYYADTCIDGNYLSEYFKTKEAMFNWLKDITNGRVTDEASAESFNADYEDSESWDENFINIHEFSIIE